MKKTMTILAFGLFAILLSCSPANTSANNNLNAASLPFADAAADTWEASLRGFFLALQTPNLNALENLEVYVPGAPDSSKLSLNFTPLERERIQAMFAQQGKDNLAGLYVEALKASAFQRATKTAERDNLVSIYFRWRTADFAQTNYVLRVTTGLGLSGAAQSFQTTAINNEAQFRFVKYKGKYVLVFENDTSGNDRLFGPTDLVDYYVRQMKLTLSAIPR